jgi:Cellulase (glycosyl hydrolase family 5)
MKVSIIAVALTLALAGSADAVQLRGAVLTPNWSAQESRFGMTPDQQRAEIAAVAQMGGNVVRLHVDWPRLQPDGRIDAEYQAQLDQAVSSAGQYGQAVILNIVGTPCWAATRPVH